jgi:hypothetical protein
MPGASERGLFLSQESAEQLIRFCAEADYKMYMSNITIFPIIGLGMYINLVVLALTGGVRSWLAYYMGMGMVLILFLMWAFLVRGRGRAFFIKRAKDSFSSQMYQAQVEHEIDQMMRDVQ